MRRNVWTAEELRDLLGGLAILAPENQPERRGFILAMASVALAVGLKTTNADYSTNCVDCVSCVEKLSCTGGGNGAKT